MRLFTVSIPIFILIAQPVLAQEESGEQSQGNVEKLEKELEELKGRFEKEIADLKKKLDANGAPESEHNAPRQGDQVEKLEQEVKELTERLEEVEDEMFEQINVTKAEKRFEIYGFFDLTFGKWFTVKNRIMDGLINPYPSFLLKHRKLSPILDQV